MELAANSIILILIHVIIVIRCIHGENITDKKSTNPLQDGTRLEGVDYQIKFSNLKTISNILPTGVKIESVKVTIAKPLVYFLINAKQTTENVEPSLYLANITSNSSCQVINFNGSEKAIYISAKTIRNDMNILAVAYRKHIEILTIQNKTNEKCGSSQMLQKILFDDEIQRVSLFKATPNNDRDMLLLHMIVFAGDHGGSNLILFRWIDSAFHQIDEKMFDGSGRIQVSVLSLESCTRPVIFVKRELRNNTMKNSYHLQVYQIEFDGKLGLKQELFVNYTLIKVYALNCENYNFLACGQEPTCSIYSASTTSEPTEFAEERKIQDENLSTQRLVYTNGLIVAWSPANQTQGCTILRGFLDSKLARSIDIDLLSHGSTTLKPVTLDLWSVEYVPRFLLMIHGDNKEVLIQLAELKLIESDPHRTADPIVDIIQRVRSLILYQKIFLDKLMSIVTKVHLEDTKAAIIFANLSLNQTTILNGTVSTLSVKNPSVSSPSRIQDHFVALKLSMRSPARTTRFQRKQIYVKRLYLDNLNCELSQIYADAYQNMTNNSSLLIFGPNTIVNVRTMHIKKLVKSAQHQYRENKETLDEDLTPLTLKLFQNIKVHSLIVRNLNKINFTHFYETAFLRNRDDFINGSIIFSQKDEILPTPIYCNNLNVDTLNTRSTKHFFTLNTDQTIYSDLFVRQFLTLEDITINTINGRNLSEFGFIGEDLTVNSPVQIENLTVLGDLTLSESDESELYDHLRAASAMRATTFTQIYNGEVRISGKLIVTDLKLSPRGESKLNVTGTNSSTEAFEVGKLNELFWMRNFSQTFNMTSVHFVKTVQAFDIDAELINNHELTSYLLRTNRRIRLETSSLHMKSVKILGDFNIDLTIPVVPTKLNRNPVRIEQVSTDLVRCTDTLYSTNIFGIKRFTSTVKVHHLFGRYLNSLPVQSLVRKYANKKDKSFINFDAPKTIIKLNIAESLSVADRIDIELYNLQYLPELFNSRSLHRTLHVKSLRFSNNISANNVDVHQLDDIRVSGMSHILFRPAVDSDSPITTLEVGKPILIKGTITFKQNLIVEKLNNVTWNDYKAVITLKDNQTYPAIGGNKLFRESLSVHSRLELVSLNGLNVERLFRQTLRKSDPQTISARWTLQNINIGRLSTRSLIEGVHVNDLIRTDSEVHLTSSLQITSVKLEGNVFGDIPIHIALNRLKKITNSSWSQVRIRQNVGWPKKIMAGYDAIRKNAVRFDANQTITGSVQFKAPSVLRMVSLDSDATLGGMNLSHLVADCLVLNTSTPLVISNHTYFEQMLDLKSSIKLGKLLNVVILNGVNVLNFNQTIYRPSSSGIQILSSSKKLIASPVIGKLVVQGSINSVQTTLMVSAQLIETSRLSPIQFMEVSTNSMTVIRMNHLDLIAFLHGRIRLGGESQKIHGSFTFEKLTMKAAIILTINGISLDRVVLKNSEAHQIIYGSKRIKSNTLQIVGPCSILNVNGAELIQRYHDSILTNHNHKFQVIKISAAGKTTFMRGINILESSLAEVSSTVRVGTQNISRQLEAEDKEALESRLLFAGTTKLVYLEYGWNIKANLSHTTLHDACGSSTILNLRVYDRNQMTPTTYLLPLDTQRSQRLRIRYENNCSTKSSRLRIELSHHQNEVKFASTIENLWTFNLSDLHHIEYALIEFQNHDQTRTLCLLRIDPFIEEIKPVQEISSLQFGTNQSSVSIPTQLHNISSQWTLFFSVATRQQDVYEFDSTSEQFLKKSSLKFAGDIIVQLANIDEEANFDPQTIVANKGQKVVTVYNRDLNQIVQQITLPRAIENLVGFDGWKELGFKIMMVTTQDSYFYVYRYSSRLEGWIFVTYGVLKDSIERILISSWSHDVAWLFPKVFNTVVDDKKGLGNMSSVVLLKLYTQH